MKKLLSILASVGLTATASTAVVACTSTIKANKVTVNAVKGTASFETTLSFKKDTVLAENETHMTTDSTPKKVVDSYTVTSSEYALMMADKVKDSKNKDVNIKKDTVVSNTTPMKFVVKAADVKNMDSTTLKLTKDTKIKVTISVENDSLKNTSDNAGKSVTWTLVKLNDTDATKVKSVQDKVKINVPALDTVAATINDAAKEATATVKVTVLKGANIEGTGIDKDSLGLKLTDTNPSADPAELTITGIELDDAAKATLAAAKGTTDADKTKTTKDVTISIKVKFTVVPAADKDHTVAHTANLSDTTDGGVVAAITWTTQVAK